MIATMFQSKVSTKEKDSTTFLKLRLIVALISLVLTVIAIITDDVINPDGALYVDIAKMAIENGIASTAQLYNWPFYSLLAAGVSQLTSLTVINSFYLINCLLFVLVTDALLCIARLRVKTDTRLVIPAVIILFFYTLNDYRDFVIRDIGYWAFCLYSVLQFVNYLNTRKTKHIYYWQLLLIVASLFRIEAVPLLTIMPLYLIINNQGIKRLNLFLHSYAWLVMGALTIGLIIFLYPSIADSFSKINTIVKYLNFEVPLSFFEKASALVNTQIIIPPVQNKGFGEIIIFSGFISVIIVLIVKAFSAPYFLLSLVAMKQKETNFHGAFSDSKIWIFLLTIQAALLFIFFITTQIQTTRYCVLAGIFLLILVLPVLTNYIEKSITLKKKFHLVFIGLMLLYSGVDAFHKSNSKAYLASSCNEITKILPASSTTLTNSRVIKHYLDQNTQPSQLTTFSKKIGNIPSVTHIVIEKRRFSDALKMEISNSNWTLIKSIGEGKKQLLLFERNIQQ